MKSGIKGKLHIIIPTLCLILALCGICLASVYRVEGRKIAYTYSVTAQPEHVYAWGYEIEDGVYTPVKENAYLVLPVTEEKEINDVRIKFKSPVKKSCEIKLAYATKDSGLSDENTYKKTLNKGYDEYYSVLDPKVYTILECYIPEEFELDSVVLSYVTESEVVTEIKIRKDLHVYGNIAAISSYLISLGVIFFVRKKKQK